LRIRTADAQDAARIAGIYNHYVVHSTYTFEEAPVSDQAMAERIAEVMAQSLPWLVLLDESGLLVGYACATHWKSRSAYRYAAECSVYVDMQATGQGHGTALLEALLAAARARGLRTLIAGVTLPNERSIALHEKLGFEQCARFRNVGCKFDRWLDVGYWQLDLLDNGAGQLRVPGSERAG
jgi:phosphinothricin acetyltransferase